MPARLVLIASTVAAFVFANQAWLDYRYAGLPLPWWRALALSAADWYLWAALVPLIVGLGRRWPLAAGSRLRGLGVHVPVSLLTAAVKTSVDRAIAGAVIVDAMPTGSSLKLFLALATYWAILGGAAAWRQADERRTREMRAARLEADLARAQLDALRVRLQPHFLFNTLNGISALMREDVEAADLMMTRLAELLRLTLQRADTPTVPLGAELEFTRHYLDIQQVRWGDRLSVTLDVPLSALDVDVPSLILQPLVENAFAHAVAVLPGPRAIAIRARLDGATLTLEVEDDGPGLTMGWAPGVGLTTTRARLDSEYGSAATLVVEPGRRGGTVARVSLPARRPAT